MICKVLAVVWFVAAINVIMLLVPFAHDAAHQHPFVVVNAELAALSVLVVPTAFLLAL